MLLNTCLKTYPGNSSTHLVPVASGTYPGLQLGGSLIIMPLIR